MVAPRISASTDFSPLDRLIRMAEQYPELVKEEAYDTAVGMDDSIRKAMTQDPPKVTGKRAWESNTQRRAYFASRGFGKGVPSIRSGRLNDAYDLGFAVDAGAITITLYNASGYSRFVVGPLTLGEPSVMQRIHIQGGYKPAAPIAAEQGEKLRAATIRNIRLIPKNFR